MLQQRTLQSSTQAVGVGLHSGERVQMTLLPAPVNTGIVFRRVDIAGAVDIPVTALSVTDTRMASTIESSNAKVQTIEHLMSAAAGLGIDNLYVDLTAEEVPILDTTVAVTSRIYRGISPFQGGQDHLSHRLIRAGLSRKQAAISLWLLSGVYGALAILMSKTNSVFEIYSVIAGAALWIVLFILFFKEKDS